MGWKRSSVARIANGKQGTASLRSSGARANALELGAVFTDPMIDAWPERTLAEGDARRVMRLQTNCSRWPESNGLREIEARVAVASCGEAFLADRRMRRRLPS